MNVQRILYAAVAGLFVTLGACSNERQATMDSAAGAAVDTAQSAAAAVGSELAVSDIETGTHIDTAFKITHKGDEFSPKDTIFASVHTRGTRATGELVGRWTFQDGKVVDERSATVTTDGDGYTVFSISSPEGLAPGKYTLHVLLNGKEVETKEVTVKGEAAKK